MKCKELIFNGHAVRRMFKRRIRKQDVLKVVEHGQIIINYPDDKPFPSFLLLDYVDNVPLHVVVAVDLTYQIC